jgi:hypothetical protein
MVYKKGEEFGRLQMMTGRQINFQCWKIIPCNKSVLMVTEKQGFSADSGWVTVSMTAGRTLNFKKFAS